MTTSGIVSKFKISPFSYLNVEILLKPDLATPGRRTYGISFIF
jgi:hypothetical protein